jgi:hypothetical protein
VAIKEIADRASRRTLPESGIAEIVDLAGAPVRPDLLGDATDFLQQACGIPVAGLQLVRDLRRDSAFGGVNLDI